MQWKYFSPICGKSTAQCNVDVCINSALAEAIEENRHNSLFCQSVFYFVDSNAWHLWKMVDLDIMVTRNFFLLALMKVFVLS